MSAPSHHTLWRLVLRDIRLASGAPGISLEIRRGERVAFFGDDPNALSLLSDVITGHVAPKGGEILIDGQDVTALPPERRRVGLFSVRDPLFDHLDVRLNIAFPMRAGGCSPAEIDSRTMRVLALVGLEASASARISSLTAEQRFRVRLGRLLAYDPQVLVLDNPLEGLDARAARRCDLLLGRLARALELTVLYATSRRSEALRFGARIAVLVGESMLQCADAATLLDRPQEERVAELFGEANTLQGRVLSIDDDVARIRIASGGVVEAMADEALDEDSLCVVSVRPDRIAPAFGVMLADEDDDSPVMATVQEVMHLGDHLRLRLRLDDGTDIELRRPPVQTVRGIRPGVRAQLAWHASQAVAFRMRDDL